MNEFVDFRNEIIHFFDENYLLAIMPLNSPEKQYLGNKNNRICRFCGKKEGETKFKQKAHAIPEFIGNKTLLSNYECATCNSYFSKLESHLSEFLKIERTIGFIKGKEKKVPVYRTNDKASRISADQKGLYLSTPQNDPIVEVDEENKRIRLSVARGTYIPRLAYKCLIKMALSIVPQDEILYFTETLSWLMNQDIASEPESEIFKVWYVFSPGYTMINTGLLRRKYDGVRLPYMLYYIAFQNFFIQTFIPFSNKDNHLINNSFQFPPCLHRVYDNSEFGIPNYQIRDFSSTMINKDEKLDISIKYNK